MRSGSVSPDVLGEGDRDRVVRHRAGVGEQRPRPAGSAAGAAPVPAGLAALASSGDGSANAPLTRWPGRAVSGSVTLSAASPAVETTFAVVVAV